MFVSSEGSPHARLRRALRIGKPLPVRIAASDLRHVSLADVVEICAVLRAEPDLFERAAVRWLGRFCLEVPALTLAHVSDAVSGLALMADQRERAKGLLKALLPD